ncbi:uncharacterized protein DUF4062 [Stella humosa]|uniref:Uncharacterized protein DUF4062 n=1 Tax=Stella humosa TaxID=94 RepID=A0A3N1KHQ9_9PROT|nr:DUF4062 domain-containing protein [Stella humosa]ROP81113.1 uncharacterized protein DUF4062 [Stella humosa]BBK32458.1 hypothetical protein STHU_30920 [Stella humosa]
MARPRVFISSTYYDLKYIRSGIETFVSSLGYEPILFEKGAIPFHHDATLEESCLKEVENSDILILIIGGRYGALSPEDEQKIKEDPKKYIERIRSVTNREYEKAHSKEISIFAFVEQSVFSEYRTFKQNRDNASINYAHVDDPRIYQMIDDILTKNRTIFVKDFSVIEDITGWLREQWAGIFVDLLRKKNTDTKISNLENQISNLSDIVKSLKTYGEELIKSTTNIDSEKLIKNEQRRIFSSQNDRFLSEPLIKYLLGLKGADLPEPEKMFSLFLTSVNLDHYLTIIGFSDTEKSELFNNAGPPATRDYERMKDIYILPPGAAS